MQRVKAVCGESRTYGLGRGKGCEALPIATFEQKPNRANIHYVILFVISIYNDSTFKIRTFAR
jgi:hypothetical protein